MLKYEYHTFSNRPLNWNFIGWKSSNTFIVLSIINLQVQNHPVSYEMPSFVIHFQTNIMTDTKKKILNLVEGITNWEGWRLCYFISK